jgi:alpha-tubulin suppressor-like RCC1 family protein
MQVVSISCGYGHCIFLTNDNRVWVTGNNHFGQKGMNDRTKTGNYPVPESPILDEKYKIKSVHAGYAHNVLVTRDGEAIGYGHNMDRQLDDSGQDIHLPIVLHDVMKFGKVIDCSCGQYSAVFLLQNRNAVIRGKIGTKTYSVATLFEISLPIISLSVGEHALFAITSKSILQN